MGGEDNVLSGLGLRLPLLAGDPAEHLLRYPPGPVQPVNLRLGDIGTHPGSACIGVKIDTGAVGTGALARAAGVLPLGTGSLARAAGIFFEVLLEPIVGLLYWDFFSRRDFRALAVPGAGGVYRKRFLRRHFPLSSESN
jgi:hypothetical protein